MRTLLLATLTASLAGCGLYFDSTPPPPDAPPCYGTAPSSIGLRNPDTGACEYFSPGGGGCYPNGGVDIVPNWAPCAGPCEALDEASCVSSTSCHAAYVDGPPPPCAAGIICGPTQRFAGCWDLPQGGPAVGPGCDGLDAQACSLHVDCASHYNADPALGGAQFDGCKPDLAAPLTCATAEVACAPGRHCADLCTGVGPVTCSPTCLPDQLPCDTLATPCPSGEVCFNAACTPNPGSPIPGTCAAVCVPADPGPGACTGPVTCVTNGPACPPDTVAGIANGCYTGFCIPKAACGPFDPGTCDGAVCPGPGPSCPTGTVPGVANGCYTGFCIPQTSCPPPVPLTCDQLPTEAACQARPDCTAVYQGVDCTCTAAGCTCASETYQACTLAGPLI